MTQPDHRPNRRSNAEYRWTKPKILAFLRSLALSGSVAAAAREVGMSRQSAYRLRARLGQGFAQVRDEGLRLGFAMRSAGQAQGDTDDAKVTLGGAKVTLRGAR